MVTTAQQQGPLAISADQPLFAEVRRELRLSITGRKGWLMGIGVNLLLAIGYVTVADLDSSTVSNKSVPFVAMALASWVLADPVNTNQLGADGGRVIASLTRGTTLSRILRVKNLALGILLFPVAFLASIAATAWAGRWRSIVPATALDLLVITLWLGVGSLASVLLPYRPIHLRERLRRRRSWFRWAVCLGFPYLIYSVVGAVALGAGRVIRKLGTNGHRVHPIALLVLLVVVGLGWWQGGVALSSLVARRRGARFLMDLERPD